MKHPPPETPEQVAALILERAAGMGVPVSPGVAEHLAHVLVEMREEPQNLSSVTDLAEGVWVHVIDSLGGLLVPEVARAEAIADIGSGGGFPGLVLAATLPGARVTLVESEGRKAEWLHRTAARFPNVRVVADRSETLARDERDRYPVVTARALGPLPVVMELAAPLLAPGGSLVAWRGRRASDDPNAAARTGEVLGLTHSADVDVSSIPDVSRYFSVWRKTAETPARYPRRPGMAAKRPIA